MVASATEGNLIHSVKLSSVGPGRMSGQDIVHEPSDIDLAMKLHYLRAVYYFRSPAFDGLSVFKIKEPTFILFNYYYVTCGRFRLSEAGRPYIKCNDCGARFIEAQCDMTLDEWLETKTVALEKILIPSQVLGPELGFSPPVLLQCTWFKCGGVSVGLSWAHILGDALSVAEFMNMWGTIMSGNQLGVPLASAQSHTNTKSCPRQTEVDEDPFSIKRVVPVRDHWITENNCKMETLSFHVTATQLAHLQLKISGHNDSNHISPFDSLCAVIWKCIAKVRHGSEPRIITICKKDSHTKNDEILSNSQVITVVKADFPIVEANPRELIALITNEAMDERRKIEETVEKEQGLSDFIVYGANLTFVNLEDATFYDFEVRGQNPVYLNYTIESIGDEGLVMVLPTPKDASGGRIMNITLPENQVMELKSELEREWLYA